MQSSLCFALWRLVVTVKEIGQPLVGAVAEIHTLIDINMGEKVTAHCYILQTYFFGPWMQAGNRLGSGKGGDHTPVSIWHENKWVLLRR